MALIELKCGACERFFTDLEGATISNTTFGICPHCGATKGERMVSSFSFTGGFNEHLIDPKERQMILANRKMHEDMITSGSRDIGDHSIVEKGPNWSRPFGNSATDRKAAIENAKLINDNG